MKLIVAVLIVTMLGSPLAVAADPPPVNLQFKARTMHAYRLADLLQSAARASKAVYEDNGRALFLIFDEVAFAKRAQAAASRGVQVFTDLLNEPRWRRACGIRGSEYVLATFDDRSGTPTDWTRKAMLARGKQVGVVYGRHDAYTGLLLNALARRYQVKFTQLNSFFDGYAVSRLVENRGGLALITTQSLNNANFRRRGVTASLFLGEKSTNDVPSVAQLGTHLGFEAPFPGRFAALFIRADQGKELTKMAEGVCARAPEKPLDVSALKRREEQLIAWARAAYEPR
jgi:hypothetical protein